MRGRRCSSSGVPEQPAEHALEVERRKRGLARARQVERLVEEAPDVL